MVRFGDSTTRLGALYLNRHPPAQEGDTVFGLWRQKREDGLTYQERLRSEWGDESTV